MKRYAFTIPRDAAEGRLLPLARRMLPGLRESALREAFEKRDVKLNGLRVGRDAWLVPGAEVVLYTREAAEPAPIPVLYQDDDLLVVRKPAGVSCEADRKGGAVITALLGEQLRKEEPGAADPLLCHRLDNPTDGLLLLAKNPEAQAAMQEAFRQRQVHKQYICLVKGQPRPAAGLLEAWLRKDAQQARVTVFDREVPGAVPIRTEYAVLEAGDCSRLLITLHTGRTHQIRAHMAFMGHPLLGDDLYGDRAWNKERKARKLMLCAVALSFELEGKWSYLNGRSFSIQPNF